ncbi:MAG: carboxypeptidase-like regulatory domain-containing protein, partial [Bacteroidota bacterium]
MRSLLLGLLAVAFAASGAAQTRVTGTVVDADGGQPLPGATVLMIDADSARTGAAAAADGTFALTVAPGAYTLRVSFVGYTTLERPVTARGRSLALDTLALASGATLENVDVQATRQRVEVRGDTTAFNADAFAVNPDATVEDLVRKLPGVQVENGTVTAEGETVQRVLVDGREFFGNDVQAAIQNLPAELVKEVQVFDRQSEESRFSGFDDGNAEKTLNIITRAGMQNGQFGRVYAGGGPDGEYLAGGNVTLLNGDRRLTIVGIANNVDQQNFATEDLAGVVASGGRRGRRGRRGGRGGGDVGNLLVNDTDGIASATALGVSYADLLAGGALRLTGSA